MSLGKTDHNLVYLQPAYKSCVIRQAATIRSFRKWTPEARESLRDCFECTDWNILLESQKNGMDTDVDRVAVCTLDYISFCRDIVEPARSVHCFPNNKPWMKVGRPTEINDYRLEALTSHIMKTLEWLLLCHLGPQVQHALDHPQFA